MAGAQPTKPASPGPRELPDGDTICGPATAPGEGAVGIVRLSGPQAIPYTARHFCSSGSTNITQAASHTVHHGHLLNALGTPIDEVLVVLMRGPRSYTREDVIEIQCHGGGIAVQAVLACMMNAGCRMAEPGEFTRRAFLNGRIDLAQAESVLEVIGARTELHHRIAQRQLSGALSTQISQATDLLQGLAAHMEAAIDFPEEDLSAELPSDTQGRLENASKTLVGIAQNARSGELIRDGVRLAILGRPNVGKSSLLNRLLGYDRAIVADIAGTTRDVLEAELAIDGVRFMVQDTAGIRDPGDAIEAEGVARSRQAAAGADLVLVVVDGSLPLSDDDRELLTTYPNALVAANKCDIAPPAPETDLTHQVVAVSALKGDGIDSLRQALLTRVHGPDAPPLDHAFLVTLRQQQALTRAADAVVRARQGVVDGLFPELVAADLREGLDALGDISGTTTADDLLERIFAEFCIGK